MNDKQDILTRWHISDPSEQKRLEILKEAVTASCVEQLVSAKEREEYNLDFDEFIVVKSRFTKDVLIFMKMFLVWVIYFIVLAYYITYREIWIMKYEPIQVAGLISIAIFFTCICIYTHIFVIKKMEDCFFLITNKRLYIKNKNTLHTIELNNISLKNTICTINSGNFIIEYNQCIFKIGIVSNVIYKMQALSYISRIYKYNIYIYPFPYQKNSEINFSDMLIIAILVISTFGLRIQSKTVFIVILSISCLFLIIIAYYLYRYALFVKINIINSFMTNDERIFYFRNTMLENIHSMYLKHTQNEDNSDLVIFTLPASHLFCRNIIFFTNSEIYTIHNGVKLSILYTEFDFSIYNSNFEYYIYFKINNKKILYKIRKKDIDFPFYDILEIISKRKINTVLSSPYNIWRA